MIKLGIIGYVSLNGHPYSFSGIINGIDKIYFKKMANWPYIYDYLLKNEKKIGFKKMKITHVWTQNFNRTQNIARSCLIKNTCLTAKEMLEKVDAVIIARDDWQNHKKLSMQFLNKKIPVFIDKPLSLKRRELDFFKPFLKNGLLMSCSGLRYSSKVPSKAKIIKKVGKIKSIEMSVINDLEKYGVHMLDVINRVMRFKFKKIIKVSDNKEFFKIISNNNITINLKCLGKVKKTFKITFIGKKSQVTFNIDDNFQSFLNTLKKFEKMINKKKSQINYRDTLNIMNTIIAGKQSNQSFYKEIQDV
jgi:hypothetical protein